ncbi:MAG TPA: hypothetical protein VHD88_08260 [Pyrinomonadaceae bacterium]|nr:hypothetical protein [Pyrinomonadaceae bacterium]
MKRILTSTLIALFTFAVFGVTAFAQSPTLENLLKEVQSRREELTALERTLVAPSEEDRTAYATLLRQPDTGIIRLIPRENKLTIGGAYYSFSRLTHEYGYGSDIALEQDSLSVGFAGADYGMLTNLGDVSLDEITLEHPSVRFLSEYVPANKELDARSEHRRFSNGETIGGVPNRNRLPVEVKTTYLLRSIDYDTTDVLVAFRVVRKDIDRSFIIVWKLLKKYPKPELARSN